MMFMTLNLDIQVLFTRASADIMMFLTAMFAYWILQRVKARVTPLQKPCKESGDQECPSDCTDDILDKQMLPSPTCMDNAKPKSTVSEKRKVLQQQPKHQPEKEVFDVSEHLALMRNHAAGRNIKETLQEFRLIQQRNEPVTIAMKNTVMQAWLNCGNIWAAENCMEEMREAALIDETSFVILIKALVPIGDLEKARILLQEMQEKVPSPNVATFDELLLCFARGGLFDDGISLLKHMHEVGVQPAQSTLCTVAKLVNGARFIHQRSSEVWKVLSKYGFDETCIDEVSQKYPSELPRLLAVIGQAETKETKKCIHDVDIKGSESEMEGLRVTLTQHVTYSNIDNMTNTWGNRDEHQDEARRSQVASVLRCVSKQGLRIPWNLEEVMLQYLGSDVHFLRLNFESVSIRAAMVEEISCHHPRLGLRHCWAKSSGICGQRTLSNGEEINEASFNRHINAGYTKDR